MPPKNDIRLISINFKPYDLYNLFGIEQSHFVNTFNTPNTLFDKHESKILTKKLSRVYDTEEGIHIMETFLWNHKTKYRKYSILFDERVNRISEKKELLKLNDYAANTARSVIRSIISKTTSVVLLIFSADYSVTNRD